MTITELEQFFATAALPEFLGIDVPELSGGFLGGRFLSAEKQANRCGFQMVCDQAIVTCLQARTRRLHRRSTLSDLLLPALIT